MNQQQTGDMQIACRGGFKPPTVTCATCRECQISSLPIFGWGSRMTSSSEIGMPIHSVPDQLKAAHTAWPPMFAMPGDGCGADAEQIGNGLVGVTPTSRWKISARAQSAGRSACRAFQAALKYSE